MKFNKMIILLVKLNINMHVIYIPYTCHIQNSNFKSKLARVTKYTRCSRRETLEAFISELQKLTKALLGLIAEALKMDQKDIEEMFENGMQSVRMNYYPPCPEPDKVIGLTPHSDGSGVTILLQVNGVEGLQIKKDGVWMPVKFQPSALAVNLGDIVEVCRLNLMFYISCILFY